MPLTKKGKTIKKAMTKTYGKKKGTQVFYASQNKGTIKGTHMAKKKPESAEKYAKAGAATRTKAATKKTKVQKRKEKAAKFRKVLAGAAKKMSAPKAKPKAKAKASKNPYTVTPGGAHGKGFRTLAKSMRDAGVAAVARRAAAKKAAKVKKR